MKKTRVFKCPEITYLLNPAFCARIMYVAIETYVSEKSEGFPYVLSYLVLPLVLHKETRVKLNVRSHMKTWLQQYSYLQIGFARRTQSLIGITNEAIEFLLQCKLITFEGRMICINKTNKIKKIISSDDDEIIDCIDKAKVVGKWFSKNGTVENIYQTWGIKP